MPTWKFILEYSTRNACIVNVFSYLNIIEIYNRNSQCYNRSNNEAFVSMVLQKYPDIDKTQYKNIFKN